MHFFTPSDFDSTQHQSQVKRNLVKILNNFMHFLHGVILMLKVLFVSVPGLEFLEPARVIDTNTLHSSPPTDDSEVTKNNVRYKRSAKHRNCPKGMAYSHSQDLCLGIYREIALTLFRQMKFSIQLQIIKSGLSIVLLSRGNGL